MVNSMNSDNNYLLEKYKTNINTFTTAYFGGSYKKIDGIVEYDKDLKEEICNYIVWKTIFSSSTIFIDNEYKYLYKHIMNRYINVPLWILDKIELSVNYKEIVLRNASRIEWVDNASEYTGDIVLCYKREK